MMENLKLTHADWKAIEDKYGNRPLTETEVSDLLRISLEALQHFLKDGLINYLCTPPGGYFSLEEVKSFATKVLGIKDGSYIHDKEEQKEDDFFTSICSSITQRIVDAKEIAEKNGNECGLSYLVGCFDLTTNRIRNYIQTHQEEYKEDNSKTDSPNE